MIINCFTNVHRSSSPDRMTVTLFTCHVEDGVQLVSAKVPGYTFSYGHFLYRKERGCKLKSQPSFTRAKFMTMLPATLLCLPRLGCGKNKECNGTVHLEKM
jgi:hypothetical protein